MESADQGGGCLEPSASEQNDECLELQLHTDEAVWMRQIGHLKDWCAQTRSIKVGIPARVATPLAASSLRLLWLFKNLQHLDITFNSINSRIEQPVVAACAELLNLTRLQIEGGHLSHHGLDLGVLTSLRRLQALSVRPHSDEELDGFEDEHLAGVARLTGLTSLSLRASENVTDEGVVVLTALTGLTQLSLVPMGLCVTREGLSALSAAMTSLESLSVGLHESRQVAALKGMQERPRKRPTTASTTITATTISPSSPSVAPSISLVLNSPEVSTSGFFTTLTLVLRPRLVSLRMATVESTDASFMLAVGTLVHLTELKMGVSMPEGGQPFTCNLAALSTLDRLHVLEFAVTQELKLPLSVQMVSMLSLSWPRLRSLSLSLMAKPEVAPEALDLLDNFRHLTSLSLFAPLDYSSDEDASAITLPVNPRYLPVGLTHLVLECAYLRDQPLRSTDRGGDGGGGGGGSRTSSRGGAPTSQQLPFTHSPQQQPHQNGNNVSAPRVFVSEGGTATSGPPSSRVSRDEAAPPRPAADVACSAGSVLLPHLEQLELNSCRISDEHLAALLGTATGLRHLELTEVKGISDAGMAALKGLTRLEHLVVRLAAAGAAANSSVCNAGGGISGVTHNSLMVLRHAGTLRHLEWSVPDQMHVDVAEAVFSKVLPALGSLQELFLDMGTLLRAGGTRAPAASSASSSSTWSLGNRSAGGGGEVGVDGNRWRERLQQALPLCTVAERPGIVLYDLWNDRTVQVVGL
ncbi:hypothetical protein Vafri_17500 [Volvox africanus]|uniref:Uncharacterized protein n=1 Tax=Volvox africanus TaxID=51714 RepID=A0A8J4BM51_9CHLO|nr:hypothetical protein Vafri_17500 [Volvox africanus]